MLNAIRLCCALVVVPFLIAASAQQNLRQADVRNVLDTLNELKREFDDKNAYDFEKMTQLGQYVTGQQAHNKFMSILRKHGFSDPNIWVQTALRVFRAYSAYKMQEQAPKMEAQMQQAMAQIQNNPNLTAEQKQQMMQMMGQSKQSMHAYMDAPRGDIEAVKPFVAEIDRTFGKTRR